MIRDLDIGSIPATIPTKEEIVGVTVKDKEVGLKISDTLPCSMLEKMLIELVEVGIGIGPALLPPIIYVIMVDHLVFIVMVITEVEIGIKPEILLHITIMD